MDKKDSVSQLQWFIQEYIYECDITLCVYRLLNLEINNGYQLKNINQLEDHNLTFVDIEATDDKHDRRFIQFSGVKFDKLGNKIGELNIVINPKQPLTDYIINLLKIDDEYLKNKPIWDEVKYQIANFLNNTIMVTFGDFDINITKKNLDLDKYNIRFFDFQMWLKKFTKNNVGLLEIAKLLYDDIESAFQHNAFFDACLLSDIFYTLKDMSPEYISHLALLSHIIPRRVVPKHKIFTAHEFSNKWENIISSNSKPFNIESLIIKSFSYKTKGAKHTIPYLYHFKGYYFENDHKKIINWNNKISVGQHTYDFYLDNAKKFLNMLLDIMKDKAVFFNDCGKDRITSFVEVIYDATKKYIALNFVNLSYLNRRFKDNNGLKIFNTVMEETSKEIRDKFKGFYNR